MEGTGACGEWRRDDLWRIGSADKTREPARFVRVCTLNFLTSNLDPINNASFKIPFNSQRLRALNSFHSNGMRKKNIHF
jgi:hypothetical protein